MTKTKPIIGITLDLAHDDDEYCYAERPWYALRKCYSECIQKAGGLPIMLTYTNNDIDLILDRIDGLLISGGRDDINPKFYSRDIKSTMVKPNDLRAEFELDIVKKAMQRDMPIFGICNGLQVINVARGGTLIQHIPEYITSDIHHQQPSPKHRPSHLIHIEENTMLCEFADNVKELMVNSTHHQAIEILGKDLIISAKAPDGIIEAIECVKQQFVIGVQWHCEYLNSSLEYILFQKFVQAAAKMR